MKVGLFFGSFNPIHQGHLMIASYMVENTDLDRIWFVVTPQNPFKKRPSLAHENDRFEMVDLATRDDYRFFPSDVEFNMPRPSYTIDTLVRLHERYPQRDFALIMGTDTLISVPKWKNSHKLLENYHIYTYPRHKSPADELKDRDNIRFTAAPRVEISASFIRESLKEGKSVRYFVPDAVYEFIDKWGIYLT